MPNKLDLLVGDATGGLSSAVFFDCPNVHHDAESEVVVMLSLTAPEVDVTQKRPPLNIVAVVDCSTSMAGVKIVTARASIRKLVDHLGPNDRLAIIGFHSSVFEVFPSARMDGTNKSVAYKKIDTLQPNGWTNFSAAMLQAFTEIKKVEGKAGCVNRIIMFTDGEPSQGVTEPAAILSMLEKALIPEISVSTFGYGKDSAPELLSEMAKRGKGNFFFVKEVEECAAMFGTELGGLLGTYAQNVKVTYTLSEGVTLVNVLDTAYTIKDNTITVPDVLGGETKHLLLKVKLPKKGTAVCARPSRVVDFTIEYDSVSEARHRTAGEDGKINYVRRIGDASTTTTPEVQAQLDLLSAANALNKAKNLADQGDLDGARNILRSARATFDDHAHVYTTNLVADMSAFESLMDSPVSYRAARSDLVASSHAYTTSRTSGSARSQAMFSTSLQNDTRNAFDSDAVNLSMTGVDPVLPDVSPASGVDPLPAPPARPARRPILRPT